MNMRRAWLSATATVLASAALLLSACSSTGGSSSGESTGKPKGEGQSGQKQPVTLKISWWGGDTRHEAMQKALKQFEAKYDWITVKPSFSGFEGYGDKLTVQLSAGDAPDVFAFSRVLTQQYGKSDLLLNYYDYKDKLPFLPDLDKYMQSPFYKYDSKLIGLPAGITSTILVYNKKLYDEAGVPYPTDNESWVSLGEKWTKVSKANAKVFGDGGWYYMPEAFPLMMKQLGSEIVDGNAKPPKATIHPDKAKTIWSWNEKLWQAKAVPRDTSDTIKIEAGNLATSLSASSVIPTTIAQTKDPLGFASLPLTFDGTGRKVALAPSPTALWGVSKRTAHPEEALLLLNFLMTDKEAVKTLGVQFGVPAVASSLDYLSKDVYQANSVEKAMLEAVRKSQTGADEYWVPAQPLGANQAADEFKTALEKYIFKSIDMNGFVAEAEKKMNDALQKANR